MKLYFNYRRLIDYVASIVSGFLAYGATTMKPGLFRFPMIEEFSTFSLTLASGSASLLGFVLAANTFLISHTQHERLTLLRKSSGFTQLLAIMKSSLWRLLGLTIYSGTVAFIQPAYLQTALVGLLMLATLSTIAVAVLIWSTMAILALPLD